MTHSSKSERLSVLIVDDDQAVLEVISAGLRNEGYDTCEAPDGDKAWAIIQKREFHCSLIDLNMPGLDGFDVIRLARDKRPDMGIIVVTGISDAETAVGAMRAGADDYITKPFNLDEMAICIEKAIERRHLIAESRTFEERMEKRVAEAVAEIEEANEELRQTRDFLENIISSSADAIITVDTEGQVTSASKSAETLLQCTTEKCESQLMSKSLVGGNLELRRFLRTVRENEKVYNYETEFLRPDDTAVFVNVSAALLRDGKGKAIGSVWICKDITQQKELERELKELSIRDNLTGLYNQRHFYENLNREMERARRQNHPLCLVLFDVDSFKQFNDTRGHIEGDVVLQELGGIVRECIRENVDAGFRYGGDEFTIIVTEAAQAQAFKIAHRILNSFLECKFDHLALSMGVVEYSSDFDVKTFIRHADEAMYSAKRAGGSSIHFYEPEAASDDES